MNKRLYFIMTMLAITLLMNSWNDLYSSATTKKRLILVEQDMKLLEGRFITLQQRVFKPTTTGRGARR